MKEQEENVQSKTKRKNTNTNVKKANKTPNKKGNSSKSNTNKGENKNKTVKKTVKKEEIIKDNIEELYAEEAKTEKVEEKKEETKTKKEFIKDTFVKNVIFMTMYTFMVEIIFRLISKFSLFNYATLRILLSTFILSLIITSLASITKRKWLRNIILLLYLFVYTIYAWLQLGFINFLGVYISFNTSSQFGAVTDYIYDFLNSFKPIYYVIFIPFIISFIDYVILERKKEYHKLKFNLKALIILPVLLISILLYYGTIVMPFMQNKLQTKSNKYLFLSPDVPTVVVNQYGCVVFGILDFKSFVAPVEIEETVFNPETPGNVVEARSI